MESTQQNKIEIIPRSVEKEPKEALILWMIFFISQILINGTIPFILGVNVRDWVFSLTCLILECIIIYAFLFFIVPLVKIKTWNIVKQPDFLIPLIIGAICISLWPLFRPLAGVAIIVIIYLHFHYDLSNIGIRIRDWKSSVISILIISSLVLIIIFLRPFSESITLGKAFYALIDRMFMNPASTIENLFYFGYLTENLVRKLGKYLTPPIIGLMYTLHEMANPQYWYTGLNFIFVFLTITVVAAFYLWHRSVIVVWCTDGLNRFFNSLLY